MPDRPAKILSKCFSSMAIRMKTDGENVGFTFDLADLKCENIKMVVANSYAYYVFKVPSQHFTVALYYLPAAEIKEIEEKGMRIFFIHGEKVVPSLARLWKEKDSNFRRAR